MKILNKPGIIEAMTSPDIFGKFFHNEFDSWRYWQTFLKALFGEEFQNDDIDRWQECTKRNDIPPSQGFEECYMVAGRQSGKSSTAALIASYLACFSEVQVPEESKLYVFIVSPVRQQSDVILRYCRGLLKAFDKGLIQKELKDEIWLKSGIIIRTQTANESARGFQTLGIILDELSSFKSLETQINNAENILVSLAPGLVPGGKIVGLSTPKYKTGLLYQVWKEHFSKSGDDVLIFHGGTSKLNPKYRQSIINRWLGRNKVLFKAEYEAEFVDPEGQYLSREDLEPVLVPEHVSIYQPGKKYYAWCDGAGGREGGDSFTLAVSHKEGDKAILDFYIEKLPPFLPSAVCRDFSDFLKAWHIQEVHGDRYSLTWIQSSFASYGIKYIESKMTKTDIFLNFRGLVYSRLAELTDNPTLIQQILSLEYSVMPKSNLEHVESALGYHDDIINSCAGSLVLASQQPAFWTETERESRMPVLAKNKDWKQRMLNDRDEMERETFAHDGRASKPRDGRFYPWDSKPEEGPEKY